MSFGNKSKPCRVYEYGCLAPVEGSADFIDVLFNRNLLWNRLVEVDRIFEKNFNELIEANAQKAGISVEDLKKLAREVEYLFDFKEAFEDDVKEFRQKARSGLVPVPEMKKRFDRAKKCYREKNAELKKVKREIRDACADELRLLEDARAEAVKAAMHSIELWWCNSDEERLEYEVARKRMLQDRAKGLPVSLRFHAFDGTGKANVRLRERGMAGPWGMPVENVFKPNNAFWIEPVSEAAWLSPVRGDRRRLSRTNVHFRIGSNSKTPVWVVLPVIMHRPLPEGGIVRAASLIRERVGRHYRYKLAVTVEMPENRRKLVSKEKSIAIDIGWRLTSIGLRVARWRDSEGNGGTLLLLKGKAPAGAEEIGGGVHRFVRADGEEILCAENILANFEKVEDLRSLRDKHFDDAKAVLAAWVNDKCVPDMLKNNISGLNKWRSQKKMARLLNIWRENRFAGDQEMFVYLEEWSKRDEHLWDWEAHQRDKALRRRRELYRVFASLIEKRYGTVIYEDFDLRGIVKKPETMKGTKGSLPQDRQRFIAAVSEFRLAVKNACNREGTLVIEKDPAYTTRKCHVCGLVEKFDARKELFHKCSRCGAFWDQDDNAAINML